MLHDNLLESRFLISLETVAIVQIVKDGFGGSYDGAAGIKAKLFMMNEQYQTNKLLPTNYCTPSHP